MTDLVCVEPWPAPAWQPSRATRVLKAVQAATGITPSMVKGRSRSSYVFYPRMAACWVLRNCAGMSLPEIGISLHRDHTTILNACRRAEYTRERDPDFKALCDRLEAAL